MLSNINKLTSYINRNDNDMFLFGGGVVAGLICCQFTTILIFCIGFLSGIFGIFWYFKKTETERNIDLKKTGITVETNNEFGIKTKHFILDDDFQIFFEHFCSNIDTDVGFSSDTSFSLNGYDYLVLKHAIELDFNNLKLFNDNQQTLVLEKLAVDKNIQALKYVKQNDNGVYRIHNYAYSKYGDEIYEYITKP